MGAQCAHALGKLAREFKNVELMVTLVMEVPHSACLTIVEQHLKQRKIGFLEQWDDFPPEITRLILQAVVTEPISRQKARCLEKYRLWT